MEWLRFYDEVVDDPKVQKLPGDLFKFWVNMLCIANKSEPRGVITMSCEDIAWRLRMDQDTVQQYLQELTFTHHLLDIQGDGTTIPHGWPERQKKSDDVTARVNKHRENVMLQAQKDETLQDEESETLQKRSRAEQNREDKNRTEQTRAEKTPARVRTRGTTIPPDFALAPNLKQWAQDEGYSPLLDLDKETKEFIQYWTVGEGQGEKRKNWQLVWQTRMKDRAERLARYGGKANGAVQGQGQEPESGEDRTAKYYDPKNIPPGFHIVRP